MINCGIQFKSLKGKSMDLTDPNERKRRERLRIQERNASVRRSYGLLNKRDRAPTTPPPPTPTKRSRVQAQCEAHRRWVRLDEFSSYPYPIAPGTLIINREITDYDDPA